MNPAISAISEEGDVLKFTLSGLNVSLENAVKIYNIIQDKTIDRNA